jgi:phosphate/sulfate permease
VGVPVSLFLIAVGAILTWAVTDTNRAVDLNVVGVILMLVGLGPPGPGPYDAPPPP